MRISIFHMTDMNYEVRTTETQVKFYRNVYNNEKRKRKKGLMESD